MRKVIRENCRVEQKVRNESLREGPVVFILFLSSNHHQDGSGRGREVENYKEEEGMSLANLFICHAVFLLEGIVIESSLFLFPLNAVLVMMRFL